MKTIQHITKTPWVEAPIPATTPAMIQAFWHRLFRERSMHTGLEWLSGFGNVVYADTYATPFIVRLYHSDPKDKRVAYLSNTGGTVTWRFGAKAAGFDQCPVATDPELIDWLDSLFWWYTATESQKQQICRVTDIRQLVADRMHVLRKKQGLWKRS